MNLTIPAMAIGAMVAFAPAALAQEALNEDIVSGTAEAQEDCEALRESLEAQRDDNVLTPRDMREMRDKGC